MFLSLLKKANRSLQKHFACVYNLIDFFEISSKVVDQFIGILCTVSLKMQSMEEELIIISMFVY